LFSDGKRLQRLSPITYNDAQLFMTFGIARFEGVERFDHGRPADVLLRERDSVLSKLGKGTLTRFEELFKRINTTLGI